jgi:hypothetical protein
MLTERGRRFKAVKASGIDVSEPNAGGLAQRGDSGTVLRLTPLNESQPVAQHFAGVLVAPGGHKSFDQACLVLGKDHITSWHGGLSMTGELAEYATGSRYDKAGRYASASEVVGAGRYRLESGYESGYKDLCHY